jgi:methylmalonyl-CoA mutase
MTGDPLSLAGEFPPATGEQWRQLAERVLKGAAFEDRLVGKTHDGLRIEPLAARDPQARPIASRAPAAPWQVLQRVDHPDPAAANAQALEDLQDGATGLTLVFAGDVGAYGSGLQASEPAIARALDGVHLDAGIAIELDAASQAVDASSLLAAKVARQGLAPAAVDIRFGFDPLGAMAAAGGAPAPWAELAPRFAGSVAGLAAQGFGGPFAVADGRPVHAAGGSEAQELAFALAAALAYLRALEAGGMALDAARRMIFFRLAADADQFLTMAKFRALRKLWARVEDACGLTPEPAFVAAETAWRMMTQCAPSVNVLRATIATLAAGLAGADAVTVLPFTAARGLPDRFARRIARNTQLVLLEESNLAKVTDPAAGAGGIEHLTDQLCRAAWTLLQQIERAGGAFAALQRGLLQDQVAAVRAAREQAVAQRRDAITGTSEFPDLDEATVAVLDVAPVALAGAPPAAVSFPPLAPRRLAAPFEALRHASDRALAANGSRPKVFLVHLGMPSDFTARASFAGNFFAAGGIEAVTPEESGHGDDMISAFKASGAVLACLCGSDEAYAAQAAAAAKRLSAAGARHVYLAGRPRDALAAAGVGTFIHAGGDALATLRAAHDIVEGGP